MGNMGFGLRCAGEEMSGEVDMSRRQNANSSMKSAPWKFRVTGLAV